MHKIKSLSTFAMLVLTPYLLLYPYDAMAYQMRLAFLDPTLWETHRWAAPGLQIPLSIRTVYFAIWLVPTMIGVAAILVAFSIVRLFRMGEIFSERVAARILLMGQCTALSPVFVMLAACVTPKIISWHNPEGALPLRLWYNAPNLSLVLCGLAFILMGAVLREGIKMARENEAFV